MTGQRRALVLDFGGVISRTLFETHALSEQALGLAPGTLTWRGPFDVSSDPLWASMQAGELSERDYWMHRVAEVGELVGERWTRFPQLIGRVRGDEPDKVIRPEALVAIQSARSDGHLTAILSNELDLFYGAGFRDKLPFMADFELIVDASHTNILKPDPAAYALITDGLALPAEHCIFVDDQLKNVHGAIDVGMQVVHFDVHDPAASYARALHLLNSTD